MNYQGPNPEIIRNMFKKVAPHYDRANDILSAGIHHLWRKKLVKLAEVKFGDKVLDCATGTGDLAIEFKKSVGPSGLVVGTDFCAEMLESAPQKSQNAELDIKYSVADVMDLPFQAGEFDRSSISFGIRNVQDPAKAVAELARVVKPGGRVLILEFGQMKAPLIREIYNFYANRILPKLGGAVTGEGEAYDYLQRSSAQFPSREDFVNLMQKSYPFKRIEYHSVSFGVAYIYVGYL
jgi:demethylmenaquinone methyltransferase/2-methoxy-6-polyprenyl-1,4-benzoquinol methylase